MPRRILIIDDEPGIRSALGQLLEFEGYEVRAVANAVDGIAEYSKQRPDLVFLDVKMAGIDGVEALKKIKEGDPSAIVVMISGHATIQTAVEATQLGAYDILEKPLDTDRILVTLRNALQHLELYAENTRLKETIQSRYEIVGRSYGIRAVIDKIERVGKTPARVLITGENGTGKELVARALHSQSVRVDGPFVEVNCAAIPSELIESELFGHMKGSFTGAVADRAGKFEQANGGTLFLDEIGDMSLAAQAKVLRVLQDGVVTRIGGQKPVAVDVRVLAATNKNVESEIAEARFREDLFYRLNVVPIHVPPLRERREDIPLLVAHFVGLLTQREGVAPRVLAPEAVERLTRLDWPGNVRELRNTIERLLILSSGPRVTADDVERLVGRRDPEQAGLGSLLDCKTFEDFKHAAERAFLLAKLRAFDWNVSETARALDMPRSNLYKKIERYGLTRDGELMAGDRDWEKELAKVDKQLASLSDEALLGPTAVTPPAKGGKPAKAAAPAAPSASAESGKPAKTWAMYARLTLAVALGAAMMVWPYEARCGLGLAAYLGAVVVVVTSGVWSSVWTWRHRASRAHSLSLLIVLWGLVLGSMEVLPRIGYAKPDLRHPADWACK